MNWSAVTSWIDNETYIAAPQQGRVDCLRVVPLLGVHIVALVGVWLLPLAPIDIAVALGLYVVRMFAITGFYHRYFAHKSFATSRWHQFLWAVVGASAAQRGPLWWAAHHRQHHREADTVSDPHQSERGFLWSHIGWFLCGENFHTRHRQIRDFGEFPELVWLDRFDTIVPILAGVAVFALGSMLAEFAPGLGTNGLQLFFWGYLVSTIALLHATLAINSLSHRSGTRRFETDDQSRNCWWLAVLTLGEGWHNNHHRYCGSARQGFVWWEVDVTYYVLRAMRRCGLVWSLRDVPARVLEEGR